MQSEILSQNQIAFFAEIKNVPFLASNFYLTGGTALAAFYLRHRYSEDLDFFSEQEINILNLDAAIRKIKEQLDLFPNNLSTAIFRFRLRLRKSYSTYTLYMLHNFCFVSLEI